MKRHAVLALALVLGACTSSDGDDRSNGPGRTGGAVIVAVLGEPPAMDPYARNAGDLTWALARPVYPSLFRYLPDGTTEPLLAASWRHEGRVVTVELEDATWSDGRAISATDVAASAARARRPSGWDEFASVRAVGPRRVELRDPPDDWRDALASVAFVLPRGRAGRVSGGPFVVESVTPGLEIVYVRNERWWGRQASLEEVRVQFVAGLDIMLALLRQGRVDVAVAPMSVNLDDRLAEMGAEVDAALGWETIAARFDVTLMSRSDRAAVADFIPRNLILETFVRDDGRALHKTPSFGAPGPVPDPLVVSIPEGDELLGLIARALFHRADAAGIDLQIAAVDPASFYGEWPRRHVAHVLLGRYGGTPGHSPPGGGHLPLARVETLITWRGAVHGLEANPTLDGPLWNVGEWYLGE